MKKRSLLIIVLSLCLILTVVTVSIFASSEGEAVDAMTEIEANLSEYKMGETFCISDDGYLGIPMEISVYFDSENNTPVSGYTSTPVIIYVVNTQMERIGTDSDTSIIQSMLDRGYIVTIFDYLNNPKAEGHNIDWSVQYALQPVKTKTYFTDPIFPAGNYYHTYIVPAGYDILMEATFWEIDKHGAEGSLEKIVDSWNNDLKGCKSNVVVPWVNSDGSRKTVDVASDGTSPVWYSDEKGTVVDQENGTYTKLKWTIATDVTDCINPDGSPIDLDLYLTLIYPTNPEKPVPVMSLSSSQGTLSAVSYSKERPHLWGFSYSGYAVMLYDHCWIPMARNRNFDYYDGNDAGGVTGNGLSYQIEYFNDYEVKTAAMRFVRYVALEDPDTYKLDTDHIGVMGNSKGGWFSLLGLEILQKPLISNPEKYENTEELEKAISSSLTGLHDKWIYEGHYGESRYEAGNVMTYERNGMTVAGGEVQPWLTYNGEEIISGAQLIYPSCGSSPEHVMDGNAPMFVINNYYDGPYSTSNTFANVCKNHDIPTTFFEVNIGHTFTVGPDAFYGVDTYAALFKVADYYLKGEATEVLYISPLNNESGVSATSGITVKFTGVVSPEEIELVTISDKNGNTLTGSWSAVYGNTEWTFTPYDMKGGTTYTVTVPEGLKGDNGKGMEETYTSTFTTELDVSSAYSSLITTENGSYVTFDVPNLTLGNSYVFRFRVGNDAANIAEVYAVSSFDPAAPDAAAIGSLLGTVNLRGAGIYEIDLTDYIAEKAGSNVTFFVKEAKTAGVFDINGEDFESGIGAVKKGNYTKHTHEVAPGGSKALKVVLTDNKGRLVNDVFYYSPINAFSYANIIKNSNISEEDYGRKFTVSFDIYDDISRHIQVELTKCSDENYETVDYQQVVYNFYTVAGEWTTISFEYTVYDTDYGYKGTSQKKGLTVTLGSDGIKQTPVYFDNIRVTETVTGVDFADFSIAAKDNGSKDYKAPETESVFNIYNGSSVVGNYNSWNDALAAYDSAYTIKLGRNYKFTDADIYTNLAGISALNIDLNGYTITCDNDSKSLFYAKSTSAPGGVTIVNVSNGGIIIGNTPLISYEDSTAAGSGKKFDFNFSDIAFSIKDRAMTRNYVSATTIASGVSVKVEASFDECTFKIPDYKLPYNSLTILPATEGGLDVSYELTAPEFYLSSQKWVSIQKDTKVSVFNADENGNYASLTLPTTKAPWDTSYAMTNGFGIFSHSYESEGFDTYTLIKSNLSTEYGMIPEEYADEELYPWVVFDTDGKVVAATNIFSADSGTSALGTTAKRTVGTWFIFLRRDVTYSEAKFNNFGFIMGDVLIDLNGKTVTCNQSGAVRMFDAVAKAGKYANITIKNGTFVTDSNPLVRISATTTGSYDGSETKTFNFLFDNITFDISSKTSALFTVGSPSVDVVGNVTFNDCTFDLTDAKDGFVMLSMYDAGNHVISEIKVVGGTIIGDTFENIKLYDKFNAKTTFEFVENEDGEYVKAIVDEGGVAPKDNIPTPEGNLSFMNPVISDGKATYGLAENPLATKYGVIPEEYSDAEQYPFVVFKDGQFWKADTRWSLAISRPKDTHYGSSGEGKEMQILMRRDYTTTSDDKTNNLAYMIGGNLVIDLGGYTFTRGSAYFLDYSFRDTPNKSDSSVIEKHNLNVTVVNGTLVSDAAIVGVSANATSYTVEKTFTMNFDGVTIKQISTASWRQVFFFQSGLTSKATGNVYYNFNNCTIDMSNGRTDNARIFYMSEDNTNKINATVTISGGDIILNSMKSDTIFSCGEGDSAKFVKNAEGEYTNLTLLKGVNLVDSWYNSDSGEKKFYKLTTNDDGSSTYIFANLETPYGTIDAQYADEELYPFVWFKNGVFKGASSTWLNTTNNVCTGAFWELKNLLWENQTVDLVLRRDYEIQTGNCSNTGQMKGTLNIHLEGHTLRTGTSCLFTISTKAENGLMNFNISNGTILLYKNALIWAYTGTKNNQTVNFTFTGVKIGYAEGSNYKNAIITGTETPESNIANTSYTNIVFNNCTFDFVTNAPSATITFIDFAGSADATHITSTTISGCVMKLNSYSKFTMANLTESYDTLIFTKGSDGGYLALVLPIGTAVPEELYNDGALGFVKVLENDASVTYELAPITVKAYTPKMSLTLDSNLVINVYIPVKGILKFTFNGVEYTNLAELDAKKVTLGDGEYYRMTVELPASEAAENVALVVTLTTSDGTPSGSFTFSIPAYVKKVLDSSDAKETEKTLVKDVLKYINDSYIYFGKGSVPSIEAIIGDYKGTLLNEGSYSIPGVGISGATFVLESTPALRFYLTGGFQKSDYSFYVNGSKISEVEEGVDATGAYLQVSLYAYKMCQTISCKVNGNDSGSYHIKAYYDFAKGENNEALANVVESFFIYCQSARAYKNEYTEN